MYLLWYGGIGSQLTMSDARPTRKVELVFFRSNAGSEPVRDWLKEMGEADRRAIGTDLLRAQWRWPVGMPLCRPMGRGLWEVRTDLSGNRTARVLICAYEGRLVALHGFIKKTRATPANDLALARKRQKELEQ
jgi:phage-related protein